MADPIQRVNYFKNQFLHVEDFTTEQAYHLEMRRRHNRVLHTFGVAEGLQLTFAPNGSAVTVRAGMAIDNQGREIVLPNDESVELADMEANREVFVTIAYDEAPTREQNETGVRGNTRVEERPKIERLLTRPAEGTRVILGRVVRGGTNGTQVQSVDTGVRSSAGAIEGAEVALNPGDPAVPADDHVRLRWAAPKQATLTGSLTVSKFAPTTPDGNLVVEGNERIGGGLALDTANRNDGTLAAGATSLVFGSANLEGIVSRRTAGGNQFGLDLITRGAPRLSVSAAGNVGIGTGGAPANAMLEVRGPVRAGPLSFVDAAGAEFLHGWIGMANNLEGTTRWLHVGGITDAGARRLALVADRTYVTGNLGVGTPTPARRLHVENSEIHSGGGGGGLSFGDRTVAGLSEVAGQRWVWWASGGTARLWSTGYGERLVVEAATGDVGIGLVDPQARLHVAGGDVRWASSALSADQGGSIELGGLNTLAGGGWPYIDFHHGALTQDFNARIQNDANGRLSLIAATTRTTGNLLVEREIVPSLGNAATSGIQFPINPGGGGGDEAFIRYFGEGGETTRLRIGINNDPDDRLSLFQMGDDRLTIYNGNVGIGVPSAAGKLQVAGDLTLQNSTGQPAKPIPAGATMMYSDGTWLRLNQNYNGAKPIHGVHTPGVIAPVSLNVGGSNGWMYDPGGGNVVVAGRISTNGYPTEPAHAGWGGGIRTFDLEVHATGWFAGNVEIDGHLTVRNGITGAPKVFYVADQFVNRLGEDVEQGDVVVLGPNAPDVYFDFGGEHTVPIPELELTSNAYDTRVCGIVAEVHGEVLVEKGTVDVGKATTRKRGRASAKSETARPLPARRFDLSELEGIDRTRVAPGQVGTFVTLGAYAHCKVDADIAPVEIGDLLTTSTTPGHAQKVLDQEQARGAVLGKALAPLAKGQGRIPVLVTLH